MPPSPVPAADVLLVAAAPELPVAADAAEEVLEELPDAAAPEAPGVLVPSPVPVDGPDVLVPVPPDVAVAIAVGEVAAGPVLPPVEAESAPDVPVGPDCAEPAVVLAPVPESPPCAWPVLAPLLPVLEPRADSGVEGLDGEEVRTAAGVVAVSANAVRPVTACTATKMSTAAPTAAAILAANLTNRDTIPPHAAPNSAGADNPHQWRRWRHCVILVKLFNHVKSTPLTDTW